MAYRRAFPLRSVAPIHTYRHSFTLALPYTRSTPSLLQQRHGLLIRPSSIARPYTTTPTTTARTPPTTIPSTSPTTVPFDPIRQAAYNRVVAEPLVIGEEAGPKGWRRALIWTVRLSVLIPIGMLVRELIWPTPKEQNYWYQLEQQAKEANKQNTDYKPQ
eukprot:TRINITY_DN4142_c0_g1_i1.p1 TRINITY_DN4142_c0_g1~~TRINITY_DN4142_c0_g1_i1.p1  ORF type:complete len:167 (+),score=36.08 TRINITY_DN4142_c0_g1_i1:22-501(+)